MSNFTPLVRKAFTFENEEIFVTFSRLTRKEVLKVMPIAAKHGSIDIKDLSPTEKIHMTQEILDVAGDMIKEHITKIENLTDEVGDDLDVEVLEDSYFLNLYTQIVMAVIVSSVTQSGKA